MTGAPSGEVINLDFEKYQKKGAYHWRDVDMSDWRTFNAGVRSRYEYALNLVPSTADTLLDIGCGDGYLLHRLALEDRCVWGVDNCEAGLTVGREQHLLHRARYVRGMPNLVNASAYRLPFQDKSFDCCLLTDVIEHVEDTHAILAEIARILKDGGMLIVSTPQILESGPRDPLHVKEFDPVDLQELLQSHFGDVVIKGLGHIFTLKVYRRPAFRSLKKRVVMLLSRWGWNPFSFPRTEQASRYTNFLFGVCRK